MVFLFWKVVYMLGFIQQSLNILILLVDSKDAKDIYYYRKYTWYNCKGYF